MTELRNKIGTRVKVIGNNTMKGRIGTIINPEDYHVRAQFNDIEICYFGEKDLEEVKKMTKRCYNVYCDYCPYTIGVVASSAREAKKLVAPILMEEGDVEWIEIKVQWNKNAKIDDIENGHIFYPDESDTFEGIKRGVYSHAEDMPCPKCKYDRHIELRKNNEVMCNECWEKEESKEEIV